jgi:tetratricopeptide (TPR) repeat protein
MIRVIRGPLEEVRRHPALAPAPGETDILLDLDADFVVPWAAARRWLAILRERLGDGAVERAVAPRRALLSLVLRRLEPALTPDERALRETHRAPDLGFLSHLGAMYRPIIEAWAGALGDLLAGRAATLRVPDLAALDQESVVLLREMLRRRAADRPLDLVFGHDPAAGPKEPIWRRSLLAVETQVALFEMLPETVVERIVAPPSLGNGAAERPGARPPAARRLDPLDDGLEREARDALDACAGTPGPEVSDLVLRAVRAAFGAYGFTAAMRLGVDLCARAPALAAADRAEVHTLIALSGYARQVSSRGDPGLADLLEEHFGAALAAEADPARRIHLLVRLCINHGRRKGELDAALGYAERAAAELRALAGRIAPGQAAFLEAGARNGRGYVLARLGRHAEAEAECEEAYRLLCLAPSLEGAPAGEILHSRVIVLDNLAQVGEYSGDRARAARWQRLLEEREAERPGVMKLAPRRWVALHRAEGEVEAAIAAAERGLAEARLHLNPRLEGEYAAELGDLLYRRGDAPAALEAFAAALALGRRTSEPDDLYPIELGAALAAGRAGRHDEALAGLRRALENPRCAGSAAQAELFGARAVLLARRGDREGAEREGNAAIERAVESGERDTLVRVARAAGEACALLGRREEARAAFERALEIARGGVGGEPRPPAADLLGILLGLKDGGREDDALLLEAIALVPAALDDADAWWDLARLLPGAIALAERGRLADPALAAAARRLARAAAQRPDGRAGAERLSALL